MAYKDELRDPRWQKKRLKIFERDKWTCQICRSKTKTLSIHHKKYIKGKKAWQYPDRLLLTVCQPCHETIRTKELIRKKLAKLEAKISKTFNRKLSREIDVLISLLES